MQPYRRTPDLVWPGHLHGTGCFSARAMATGFPSVVWRLCLGLGFALTPPLLAGVLGACACVRCVRLGLGLGSLLTIPGRVLGCVCVCVRAPPYPATPGWGVQCGSVCVWARVSAAPRHS